VAVALTVAPEWQWQCGSVALTLAPAHRCVVFPGSGDTGGASASSVPMNLGVAVAVVAVVAVAVAVAVVGW
jgi:hypothetical protein